MSENKIEVYNLGNRVIIHDGVKILAKRVTKIEENAAKRLLKMYPKELVEWGKELPSDKKNAAQMTLEQARTMVAEADNKESNGLSEVAEEKQEEVESAIEEEKSEEVEEKPKKKGRK